jgi:hypothetical protein
MAIDKNVAQDSAAYRRQPGQNQGTEQRIALPPREHRARHRGCCRGDQFNGEKPRRAEQMSDMVR